MSTSSTNTLGKYQIIREIARSNDVVYEALDPTINRRIALKELWIPPNLQGAQKRERIERFWREGKAAGRLSHPNIVTIFEVGKEGDRHFIAMEYLEGQTLRDAIQAGGPMPLPTVKDYALQLCSALAYAHQNGVVHRDIKPENVQILPGGHVKLTDFGIARLMGEASITQDGQVFGTPSYMSPEQVAGKSIDTRSDIFSLGVLLYEMVAGKKPFAGDSVVTITYNIMHMDAPPPPGAPPYLVGIIRKAMAKDANMRYQTVEELAEDLRNESSRDPFQPDYGLQNQYPSPYGQPYQPYQPYQPPPPQQQQPSVPITPYGTPIPSPGAGAPPTSVPDPFAQVGPPPSTAPPGPPQPIVKAETRNFLGVLFLVVAVAGLVIFAVWSLNAAYQSYVTSQNEGSAARYYNQGVKIMNKGDIDAAEEQFQRAIDVAPRSKTAEKARDQVFVILTYDAHRAMTNQDAASAGELGDRMVEMRPKNPEGHFYRAFSYELLGDTRKAVEEYDLASQLAGNDQAGYGPAARERSERLKAMLQSGGPGPAISPQPAPPAQPLPQSDIPFQPSPGPSQ